MGAAIDRELLAKLCGMFGSDHAGERANAAAVADKLVRQAGLRWPDVILPALSPPPRRERDVSSNDDAIAFCHDFAFALTAWEREFVASLAADRYRRLTPKQMAVLVKLVEKCRRAEKAAA
jgi:hypothetical protein